MPAGGLYGPVEHYYCEPVAEAFAASAEFRDWLLARVGLIDWVGRSSSLKSEQHARRPKARFWWKNYFCGDSRCTCPGLKGREVDILLFARRDGGKTVAIHIECKHPRDRFHAGQAESYPVRAACWASGQGGPRSLLPHDRAVTALICDRRAKHAPDDLRHFGSVIYFDEISERIAPYPTPTSFPEGPAVRRE
jgi:hypothetical protein